MKENTYKDIPLYAQHFLVHVIKRCTMVLVKWIDNMPEQTPEWLQDFLTHVGKMNAMILVKWIDDMKDANKGEPQKET